MNLRYRGPQDLRVLTGRAGESTTIAAFAQLWLEAAPWTASEFLVKPERIAGSATTRAYSDAGYHITPDLWLSFHSALVECKASMTSRRFYTTRRQFEAYGEILRTATWPIRPARVYYAFVEFAQPKAQIGEPIDELDARLRSGLQSVAIVDRSIVAGWAAEFGDYGKDWSNAAGEVVYENFFRLTTARVRKRVEEIVSTSNDALIVETEELRVDGRIAPIFFLRTDTPTVAFEGALPTRSVSLFDAPPVSVDASRVTESDSVDYDERTWRYEAAWF